MLSQFQTNRIRLYVLPDPHAVHSGLAGSTEIKASLEIVADEELDNVTHTALLAITYVAIVDCFE